MGSTTGHRKGESGMAQGTVLAGAVGDAGPEVFRPSLLARYAVMGLSVGLALMVTLGLEPFLPSPSSAFFFAAVTFSAWYGGLGPGVTATFASTLALDYFFLSPTSSLFGAEVTSLMWEGVFLLVALTISSLTAVQRRTEQALRGAQYNLERRVQDRTAELRTTNETLQAEVLERRRTEAELERLRHQQALILQSVADGIHVLDPQGRAIFVNPAAARMSGYTVEEMLAHPMHELLHHAKADGTPYPQAECPIMATLTEGSLQQATEVFWRKDGTSFPVEYTSAPMREQGAITGAVITFRDISERRAVERLKEEFISVVSHELRTPLTSIRGALGLLASGALGAVPEKGQGMVDIAVGNTDRLVRLINDILDVERIQSGTVTMHCQHCDAAALLTHASEEMRGLAQKAGITLAVTSQALPLWADPDRIVQTLTNLVGNAVKFSPPGSTVWISVVQQGAEVLFTVRDQGRGVPADKMESIFERFQQVDASDAREKGGSGLGLAICRSIVQQHGGRIWVESELGKGATFFFTLPATERE